MSSNSGDPWYYGDGSARKGPFSVDQMQTLYQAGTITPRTLVWRTGMVDWMPLRESDLAERFSAMTSPPVLPAAPVEGGLIDAMSRGFSQYAVFSGRATRSEFWWFWLGMFLISIGTLLLDVIVFGVGVVDSTPPFNTLFSLAVFLPSLALSVRRLHDTDRSGWWLSIILVPLAGIITLIVFWCLPGTAGRNRYG